MKISHAIELHKNFGFDVAFSSVCASLSKFASDYRNGNILHYLKEEYKDFISEYQRKNYDVNARNDNSKIIWTLWLQGDSEEVQPEVIRMCLKNIKKNCGSHPVKILTADNYHNYVDIPGYIIDKVNSGQITYTHLSDLIRMGLLLNHGGMWTDATIFSTKKIPEEIFDTKFFTVKHAYKNVRNVSKERWTGFLQASESHTILSDFIYHFFLEYWKKQKILIHYLLIDYVFALAYNEIPACRNILDSVPLNNPELYNLENIMSSKFDETVFKKLTDETMFFKLSWKSKYNKKTILGSETFYAHLLEYDPAKTDSL
jgi:hypothetical protein